MDPEPISFADLGHKEMAVLDNSVLQPEYQHTQSFSEDLAKEAVVLIKSRPHLSLHDWRFIGKLGNVCNSNPVDSNSIGISNLWRTLSVKSNMMMQLD